MTVSFAEPSARPSGDTRRSRRSIRCALSWVRHGSTTGMVAGISTRCVALAELPKISIDRRAIGCYHQRRARDDAHAVAQPVAKYWPCPLDLFAGRVLRSQRGHIRTTVVPRPVWHWQQRRRVRANSRDFGLTRISVASAHSSTPLRSADGVIRRTNDRWGQTSAVVVCRVVASPRGLLNRSRIPAGNPEQTRSTILEAQV